MFVLSRFTGLLLPALLLLAGQPARGQHFVDLAVTSPEDGQAVAPGAQINWEISALVTGGDSQGLALIAVNLVQEEANPELFDLPPADNVPPGMEAFAPPSGVSNPDQGAESPGYAGTQMAGNLVQIGGGQNTSGEVSVVQDVGLGPGRQVIATGSFPAPETLGSYLIRIESPTANLLETVNSPPQPSAVVPAETTMTESSFQFTVSCPCGDVDGSGGLVDLIDLATFALCYGVNPPTTGCSQEAFDCSDLDGSGAVDLSDFSTFALWYGLTTTSGVPNCTP